MTLRRRPGSEGAVLLRVIQQLTPEEIDDVTGKGIDHFYHLSANKNGQRLHLRDAARLDAALEAKGLPPLLIPHAINVTEDTIAKLGGRAQPARTIDAQLRHIATRLGRLNEEADDAMADGVLDRHERHRIDQAGHDLSDAALGICKAVEPPADVATMPRKGAA